MKRSVLAIALTLMLLFSLTACGGGSAKMESSVSHSFNSSADMMVESAPMEPMEEVGFAGGAVKEEAKAEAPAKTKESSTAARPQKLIRTGRMEMETTTFDEAANALEALTDQMGGYFENSSIANHRSGARWADYTIRIPAEKYDLFLKSAGELCHVTWQETTQEDISEAYYDTEGRLKTQQIKLERLQDLLSKAEVMEDIITIESAISETEWEIENLSGTLRRYDGKVDYATIYINLQEVYKLSNVEEVPDSFMSRMGNAFGNGLDNFVDNMEDLAVSFAYSWMWWLLFAVVAVVAVRVLRKRRLPSFLRKKKSDDSTPKE